MQSANTRLSLPSGPTPAVPCRCRQRRLFRRAVRTSAILAPPVSKQVQPGKEEASTSGILSAFSNASQFVNGLKLWSVGAQAPQLAADVLEKVCLISLLLGDC
jgi:hypothetical protein